MTITTKLMAAVAVVLCGWMVGWQLWPKEETATAEAVAMTQAAQQGQLNYLQSRMDSLTKEVADHRKLVLVYKHAVLAAKGPGLNENQDIQQMVEAR